MREQLLLDVGIACIRWYSKKRQTSLLFHGPLYSISCLCLIRSLLNDKDYHGGFTLEDVSKALGFMESNAEVREEPVSGFGWLADWLAGWLDG